MPKRTTKTKVGRLFNKAWDLQSKYLRSKDADFSGYATCYTCGRKYAWQLLQAGHYHHGKLDFDLMNIHPQCIRCNGKMFLNGNLGAYGERLIQDHGIEAVADLRRRAGEIHKYTEPELETIIDYYETKLKELS